MDDGAHPLRGSREHLQADYSNDHDARYAVVAYRLAGDNVTRQRPAAGRVLALAIVNGAGSAAGFEPMFLTLRCKLAQRGLPAHTSGAGTVSAAWRVLPMTSC